MANRAFSASKYGQQLANVSGARKLKVATFGESHGMYTYLGATIQDACWRVYPADIYYDNRSVFNGTGDATAGTLNADGTRGYSYAVGGSTTVHLLNYQVPQAVSDQATDPKDIAFIQSGYNDQGSPDNTTITNRVISASDQLLAGGYKYVVIGGISPRGGMSIAAWQGYNARLRKYVANTPNTFFMDVTSAIADFTTNQPALREIGTYAAGTFNSMTGDGTHWAMRAWRAIAPLVADILKQICSKRTPRLTYASGTYAPTTNPYANILGDAGLMMGTSGLLNNVANTGVAGTGTSSRISITVTGAGLVVTPSIVTGSLGERKQRLDLSSSTTTSGSPYISLAITPTLGSAANGGVSTRKMDTEAVVNINGVTGLCETQIRHGSAGTDFYSIAIASSAASNGRPDSTTEDLFMYSLLPVDVPTTTTPGVQLFFFFRNGIIPTGYIDVSRWSTMLVAE